MITIKNVKTPQGTITSLTCKSQADHVIDAKEQLLMLPALVDSDTGYLTSLDQISTQWKIEADFLLKSGITTVILSKGVPPKEAKTKAEQISRFQSESQLPLNISFFADGNDPSQFDKIGSAKDYIKGIKVSIDLGSTPIAPPYTNALDRIFQIAAQEDLIIIFGLEKGSGDAPKQRKNALDAIKRVIALTEKYSAQLCLQHIRTNEEVLLIKEAKAMNLLVYGEIAYPHLFITEQDASNYQNKIGPPLFLPSPGDQAALWGAINDGTIEMVGSGGSFPFSDQRFNASRLLLPSLLTAYGQKKLNLDRLISITRVNAESIFRLPPSEDIILVDLTLTPPLVPEKEQTNSLLSLLTKKPLTGWPIHVIAKGQLLTNST